MGDSANLGYLLKLCSAKGQVNLAEKFSPKRPPYSCFHTFKLVPRGEYYYLAQANTMGIGDMGILDLVTTTYLHCTRNFPELSFTAVLSSSVLDTVLREKKSQKLDYRYFCQYHRAREDSRQGWGHFGK